MRRYDLVELYCGVRLAQIFWPIVVGFAVCVMALVTLVGDALFGQAAFGEILLWVCYFGIFVAMPVVVLRVLWVLCRMVFPKPVRPTRTAPRGAGRIEPRLYG